VADKSLLTTASVFYDAVFVPGGANSVAFLEADADAVHFLDEAYRHCKVIAADPDAMQVLRATRFGRKFPEVVTADTPVEAGIIVNSNRPQLEQEFITAVSQHRVWEREDERKVPA
jgi:catalase